MMTLSQHLRENSYKSEFDHRKPANRTRLMTKRSLASFNERK